MTTLHIEVSEDLLGKHVSVSVKGAGSGELLMWALERFATDTARLRYAEAPTSMSMLFDMGTRESASARFVILNEAVLNGSA